MVGNRKKRKWVQILAFESKMETFWILILSPYLHHQSITPFNHQRRIDTNTEELTQRGFGLGSKRKHKIQDMEDLKSKKEKEYLG